MRVLKYVLTFRWANVLSEIAGYLSAVALILATIFMTYGVSLRYFFGKPTPGVTMSSGDFGSPSAGP